MLTNPINRSRRWGLATRLTWAFVLLAVALLLIVGLVLTLVSYSAQLEQITIRQQKTADEAALITSVYLDQAQSILETYTQVSSLESLMLRSMQTQQENLRSFLTDYSDSFQEVVLLDDEGNELVRLQEYYTYHPFELGSWAGTLAFETAIQGKTYVAEEVRIPEYSGTPTILMAAPLKEKAGEQGVLAVDVSIQGMWDAVAEVEVGETGYSYIVDRNSGELVAHTDLRRYADLKGQRLTNVPIIAQVMAGDTEIDPQYEGLEGERVIGAATPLPGTNWVMIVELPTEEALRSVRQMIYLLAGLLVVGVVVAASLGLFIPRRIVKPLMVLQEGAQEIGAGHLDHIVRVDTGDEIQDLAEAVNEMAVNLKTSQEELERWGREMEERVEERTHELAEASERMERRAVQLQISAEVAHAIASVRDLDRLLTEVTRLISERFGWYHAGIFLLDDSGEQAVLQAANSEGGQRMLARGHSLRVGTEGIVGSVTGTGQPRIALDVGDEAIYFDNPDLPDTRSEMALPLIVGGQVIGALDVQSRQPSAYDEEDVALLSNLADQVAVAIENARLFERTERALDEVQKLHRQYVQREWADVAAPGRDLAFEYTRADAPLPADTLLPEAEIAMLEGDVIALPEIAGDNGGHRDRQGAAHAALAAPIKLRDQVIGVLDLQDITGPRYWTEDEISLVQAVSDQVALALENARLFADTQRRAEQLATLHRIGLTITSALNLEEVLQALYERIQDAIDIRVFYVALYDAASKTYEFPLFITEEGLLDVPVQSLEGDRPSLTGYVIQSRALLDDPDMTADRDKKPYKIVEVGERQARSYLGVPMLFRDEVLGVLSVQSYEPNAFTKADGELLTTIATQATIAIQNARAYARLVETAEELREIDRLKTQFLANMSHELRTPLNSIIGFSRVMLKGIDGPLTDLQEADLNSIYSSGQHLLGLINSILDMSKIEAGKMDLSFDEVDLSEVFGVVLSTARGLLKDRPIQLVSDIPEDLPTVWADTQRIRQVFFNLVSNAAKFTEEGQIAIRASADDQFVTISVSDTGIGIEPEARKRLFIPFQQVDASTSRRAGGTGLGLAISRSFVELHGGEIWVESDLEKGSTFFFTLPVYEAVRKGEEESEGGLDPSRKAVLAVDDDEGVITLLKRYLESEGYQVIGVKQSHTAVETAQRLASDLAAITLDVVMPNMDGWQVLRALKQNPQTRDIPVVLCSIVEGLDQGMDLGAAACLRKPVTRDEILDVLEKVERPVTNSL